MYDVSSLFPCVVAKDLLSKMLNPHPVSRASIEDILSHPWLQYTQQHHQEQPHKRPLTRHPAKSFLCDQTGHEMTTSRDEASTDSTEIRYTKTTTKSSRSVKPHHKTVIRKNSSGYSSGCASDLPSPAGPLSTTNSQ